MAFCTHDNCEEIAVYGHEENEFCGEHKLDGMEITFGDEDYVKYPELFDLNKKLKNKNKVCIWKDCSTQSHFNWYYSNKKMFCNRHKLDGMINIMKSKKENVYECEFDNCNYSTDNKKNLVYHVRTHTGEKPHKCNFSGCTYASSTPQSLLIHKRIHTNYNPYKCDIAECKFVAKTSCALTVHKRIHTGEKPYKCDHFGCKFAAASSSNLNKHKHTHTGEIPFSCTFDDCNYSTADKSHLKIHLLTHTGEKPHKCTYPGCEYNSITHGNLVVHMRTHTGEKPYVCDFPDCDYTATTSSSLIIHKRRHVGEKPYCCNFIDCKKSFVDKGSLRKHLRIHNDEKPHICDFPGCNFKFSESGALTNHKRTHTGEKPYACNFPDCDYAAAQLSTLLIHQRIHTGEKPFVCDYPECDYASTQSGHLLYHKNALHSFEGIRKHKIQEQWIAKILEENNIKFKREHCIDFTCFEDADKSYARVDFILDHCKGGIMILEIDENQHRFGEYSVFCDIARMTKIIESLTLIGNNLPTLFIRLNSNGFQVNGRTTKCLKRDRAERLVNLIKNFKFSEDSPPFQIQYMYYDIINNNKLKIHDDPDYNGFVKSCCLEPII